MKLHVRLSAPIFTAFASLTAMAGASSVEKPASLDNPSTVTITSGIATFDSTTNMPGIGVKGKSTSLSGEVVVARNSNGLSLQSINATLPVKTLATGMKVRDEHMRKMIFETSSGEEPDLQFKADSVSCGQRGSDHEFSCTLPGSMEIRGIFRPVEVSLHVKAQSASDENFKVDGDGLLKLSDYGIKPPTQFGVSLANEVKFHFELTGKGAQTATRSTDGDTLAYPSQDRPSNQPIRLAHCRFSEAQRARRGPPDNSGTQAATKGSLFAFSQGVDSE